MTENKTCRTCKFSRTEKVYDPVTASVRYKFDTVPGLDVDKLIYGSITKCHLQGAPQQVNPDKDWCYKWEENT